MKLEKTTKINAIIFRDERHKNAVVCSANLNMSFGEYLEECKKTFYTVSGSAGRVPNSINKMLDFDYTFVSNTTERGYTFKHYKYSDTRFKVSFIELKS